MPVFIITPDKSQFPSAPQLMEELHRGGYPVEINIKGTADNWNEIQFYEPGPPELECILSSDGKNAPLKVSVSHDAPSPAKELQLFLVDLLLKELGGKVDNAGTRERFNADEFAAKLKVHKGSSRKATDLFWIGFSWVVVASGLAIYIGSPHVRGMAALIVTLSFLSALGQTYSHFKHE